ncbi:Predicted neuraminidase (sialidase) [Faunimonas pinastri]|uniref:Predicted neuraminidase (Sialidase) n=1 Tax=Faunimonas pinastri TaxID=1855383 RepID=A0A1H9IK92_9HYPH|nr:exo-alpha-sialidase [Faunimonas pinastri]SEQ74957.1 Predicted neuraminidase (sialidase) [Faunimonas pinastri]
MNPEEIAAAMTGRVAPDGEGRSAAFLPSPMIQNHAAFLAFLPAGVSDGALACAWFGGTLEGKSDISIFASVLSADGTQWSKPTQLTDDPARSEQNPVISVSPAGAITLFHTAQPAGNQDECLLRQRPLSQAGEGLVSGPSHDLGLPRGTFVRAPLRLRDDGAWMLPVFFCNARPGWRWTGRHDTAGVAVSADAGETWSLAQVPGSLGCVHMTIVPLGDGWLAAFFRRRKADSVFRTESGDGGRSWSIPAPTDVPNNNSSLAAIALADGRVALLCNPVSAADTPDRRQSLYDELDEENTRPDTRSDTGPDTGPDRGGEAIWGVPRAPLALCLSEDGGLTFPLRRIVEDGPGTCLSNNSLDGRNRELSYPSMVEGPDGALHMAFTFHRRAIKYVRLAPGWAG